MSNKIKNFENFTIDGKNVFYANFESYIRIYNGSIVCEDGYGRPYVMTGIGQTIIQAQAITGSALKEYNEAKEEAGVSFSYDSLQKSDLKVDVESHVIMKYENNAWVPALDPDDFIF